MTALIADDDRGTRAILQSALNRAGLEVIAASDGASAWALLRGDRRPSIAIVDWLMPEVDGLELCRRIRQDPALATMYVIVLTAKDGQGDLVAGLEAGADDYIVKPFDLEELQARVRVGLRMVALQKRLAAKIAELEIARDALDRLASRDALTDLFSRRRWYEAGANELGRYKRYRRPFSILLADLDFFKRVNDTFGHAAGDEVLRRFARLLQDQARRSEVLGRVGGEEFAILLPETALAAAREFGLRILHGCRTLTVDTPSGIATFTCSIGVAEAALGDDSIEAVVARADAELYAAKRGGRDQLAPSLTAPMLQLNPAGD